MAKSQYKYGREREKKVAELLRSKGASVRTSRGSRGPGDLAVTFPTGTKWLIEVKSSRSSKAPSPSRADLGGLKQSATRIGATAVVARVTPRGVEYSSARSGRKLTPPPRKKR